MANGSGLLHVRTSITTKVPTGRVAHLAALSKESGDICLHRGKRNIPNEDAERLVPLQGGGLDAGVLLMPLLVLLEPPVLPLAVPLLPLRLEGAL
jgi:hypothetical protein